LAETYQAGLNISTHETWGVVFMARSAYYVRTAFGAPIFHESRDCSSDRRGNLVDLYMLSRSSGFAGCLLMEAGTTGGAL